MVELDKKYWHSMDKQAAQNLGVDAREIGISHGMGDVLEGFKSKIFTGSHHVELGFTGAGKGNLGSGSTTPEMFGKDVREDIRQLSKINKVQVSTHATVGITGLAGQTQRGFDEAEREKSIHEIKRAVDFAAETGNGGPVVFHTGEFPRSVANVPGEKFEAYPGEKEKAVHYLVNKDTGQIFQTVREDEEIWLPVPVKKDGKIVYAKNPDGSDREITMPGETKPTKIPEYALDKEQNLEIRKLTFSDFKKELKTPDQKRKAAKLFFEKTLLAEREHAMGQAEQYEMAYKDGLEDRKKVLQAIKFYQDLKGQMKEEDYWKLAKEVPQRYQFIPPDVTDPIPYLHSKLRESEKHMSYGKEIAVSSRKQAARLKKDWENTQLMEEYGIAKSADSIGRLGIYAYDKEKQNKLENPLFVAPENLFPEWGYGGHPQELKELVIQSRAQMEKKLVDERGMNRGEAKKLAEDHIKATFDVAHANMWKKFFKGDPNKSIEENDKSFKKWLVDEAGKLQKEGILGHVHLSDNFGYNDEHLTSGQGNVPIKEFVEKIKLEGYKGKMVGEIGAQPQGRVHEALTGPWKVLNSPIYRTDVTSQTWTDIENSYFGRTRSPSYVVGEFAPDQREWTLYSGVPLE